VGSIFLTPWVEMIMDRGMNKQETNQTSP